jgi:hypothetical protein
MFATSVAVDCFIVSQVEIRAIYARGISMSDIKTDDASDRATERWSVKEGLVLIPVLSSALALTWEVGYFLRIGGGSFGLFSLAEHITFAVQGLPVAIAVATLAAYAAFFKSVMPPSSFMKWMPCRILMGHLTKPRVGCRWLGCVVRSHFGARVWHPNCAATNKFNPTSKYHQVWRKGKGYGS